jgi:hypothetical protein
MLSTGTLLVDRYRVIEHVGAEGTMAEVYRAVDEQLDQTVAIKLLGPPTAQAWREADTAVELDHPGIVRTYGVFEQDGWLCLAQEWIEGQSLAAILDSDVCLDVAEIKRLGYALTSALAVAHRHGILHRDLTPSNVLRTVEGNYKLVGFGAVGLLKPGLDQTRAGEVAGTPLYMSPEQAIGAPQTPASDVYGLGLLFFRCLYGTTPGDPADNYLQLLDSRTRTATTVPPSPLQELLQRCLAFDPKKRPQSAEEVLYELVFVGRNWPVPKDLVRKRPNRPSLWQKTASVKFLVVVAMVASTGVVLATAGAVLPFPFHPPPSPAPEPPSISIAFGFWLRVVAGLVIAVAGLLIARRVRRLASKAADTQRRAASILIGAGDRDTVTKSMVLEVDQVVAKLKTLDAKFLGYTMVMLIREAEEATESADRVAALSQMVTLMDKLMKQLSPWHVRHKEAIATSIAIVGSLVGVASVIGGFLR